jgi:hypothetical protein
VLCCAPITVILAVLMWLPVGTPLARLPRIASCSFYLNVLSWKAGYACATIPSDHSSLLAWQQCGSTRVAVGFLTLDLAPPASCHVGTIPLVLAGTWGFETSWLTGWSAGAGTGARRGITRS